MTLGQSIKHYREQKGMTQAELAKELKVSQPAIGKYEKDDRTPSPKKLIELSNILNHDFVRDYLSGLDDFVKEQERSSIEALEKARADLERANALYDEIEALQDFSQFIIPACIEGMGYEWKCDYANHIWIIETREGITKYASNDKVVELFNYFLKHLKMDFDELLSDGKDENNGNPGKEETE